MANAFVVTDLVAKEALRIAHEKLSFIGTVDRQYDSSFKTNGQGRHGATLRVKKPNQYTRRQGSRIMSVQDQDERASTITVATQDGVDMRFNSAELIQSVASGEAFNDLSKNYIAPAMSPLISGIESDFIAFATKATWNTAGTAGTPPTDLVAVGAARAKMNQGLAPKDGQRYIQYDSVNMGTIVNGLKGLFQDSTQIKEQYREGMVGRTAMADWYENDRMWTLTNGSDVTCTMAAAAAVTDGALSSSNGLNMTMASLSAAPATGAVFTVPGVYACHPETKAVLPGAPLQQFTIVSGSTTIQTIAPQIFLTGPRQNVCSSAGAQLTTASFDGTGIVPVFVGAASTSYVQNLMYHKEAFQFVTADLPIMDDAQKCVQKTQDGLTVRVWMGSDIRNDELLMRLDILYGFAALRPEWACRITM
jgi:P22 coat protein - gene protein 5